MITNINEFKKSFNKLKPINENETKNYMFFNNLNTIKRHVDMMLAKDRNDVDKLLENGHDQAVDHIATSKDDIEEVCNFLCENKTNENIVNENAQYYEDQLAQINLASEYPGAFQIRDGNGNSTKQMNLNEDSANILVNQLSTQYNINK